MSLLVVGFDFLSVEPASSVFYSHLVLDVWATLLASFAGLLIFLGFPKKNEFLIPHVIAVWFFICVLGELVGLGFVFFDTRHLADWSILSANEIFGRYVNSGSILMLLLVYPLGAKRRLRVFGGLAILGLLCLIGVVGWMRPSQWPPTPSQMFEKGGLLFAVPLLMQAAAFGRAVCIYRRDRHIFSFLLLVAILPFLFLEILLMGKLWNQNVHVLGTHFFKFIGFILPTLGLALKNIENYQQTKSTNKLFRLTLDATNCGILVVEESGKIGWANRTVGEMFGYQRSDLLGQSVRRLVHEFNDKDHLGFFERVFEEFFRGKQKGVGVLERESKLNGATKEGDLLPVRIELNPIYIGERKALVASIMDMTQLDKVHAELQRKQDDIQQFVYSVSHDLKSPVVTIAGFIDFIKKDLASHNLDGIRESIECIDVAAQKMSTLLRDLLSFSGIGYVKIKPERIDLDRLMEKLFQEEATLYPQVRFHIEAPLGYLYADHNRLLQALENVISNSIKYNDKDIAEICVKVERYQDMTSIGITDNGPGIPRDIQDRVFELFQRADSRTEGNGLGLAIVRKVMQLHHGEAFIDPNVNHGLRIWLVFNESKLKNP